MNFLNILRDRFKSQVEYVEQELAPSDSGLEAGKKAVSYGLYTGVALLKLVRDAAYSVVDLSKLTYNMASAVVTTGKVLILDIPHYLSDAVANIGLTSAEEKSKLKARSEQDLQTFTVDLTEARDAARQVATAGCDLVHDVAKTVKDAATVIVDGGITAYRTIETAVDAGAYVARPVAHYASTQINRWAAAKVNRVAATTMGWFLPAYREQQRRRHDAATSEPSSASVQARQIARAIPAA